MPISSNATGLRPGVCTSTTRPTAPFNGQVIYETDTKQTLVWQGSAWVMLTDADTPPGLELVATATVTNQSQITIDGCFTSSYVNYQGVLNITASSSTTSYMLWQNRSGGSNAQSSYSSNGAGYYLSGGTAFQNILGTNFQNVANGFVGSFDGTAGSIGHMIFDITSPALATHTSVTGRFAMNAGNTGLYGGTTSSAHFVSTAYDGIRLFVSSGSFSGTLRIYGYRNS